MNALAFSPAGHRIDGAGLTRLGRGSELQVWDADTGQELLTLKGHTGSVTAVGFSPDGHHIWSAGRSGSARAIEVRVWDGTPLVRGRPDARVGSQSEAALVADTPDH